MDESVHDRLDAARGAARRVETARAELADAVQLARGAGHSWAAIGEALGVSRQAAFKRFGFARDPRTGEPMRRQTPREATEIAESAWRLIDAGDYEALAALLHERAREVLDRDKVLDTWAHVVADGGRLESVRDSTVELPDGSSADPSEPYSGTVVVASTLVCEAAEWLGRVAVDADGRITGLVVVPPETADLPF